MMRLVHMLSSTTVWCLLFLMASPACCLTAYYVSKNGNDDNAGTSASAPWKTVACVNAHSYMSGDVILFRAGDTFTGQINVNQSGLTLGSYGGSVKPVISGAIELRGWTIHSGRIYKTQAAAIVKNLFANGRQMTLARYPNAGFLRAGSTNGTTTLTAGGLQQAAGYWNGANLRIRTTQYTYETRPVSSFDGTTLVLPPHPSRWPDEEFSYGIHPAYGFYLDNKLEALDAPGEWYCDPSTNVVYFYAPSGANPSGLTVIGSVFDFGVNSTASTMTIKGLDFRYQAHSGIRFSGTTSGNKILSNNISNVMTHGVRVEGTSSSYQIDGNTIHHINGRGIFMWKSASSVISNNTIKDIGLVPGIGVDGEHGCMGIILTMGSTNNVIRGNMLDSLGYSGIQTMGTRNRVERNVIKNCMLTLNDGGALYNYNELEDSYAQTWRNNIIVNVVGGGLESSDSPYLYVYGLYMDFKTHDMVLEGNTVVNVVNGPGLYMQYAAFNNTIRNNTFYNNKTYAIYVNTKAAFRSGGNTITGNILFSTGRTYVGLHLLYDTGTYHPVGTFDSNYYCAPSANLAIARVYKPASKYIMDRLTLEQWRIFSGQDGHSCEFPTMAAPYERDTILVNTGNTKITVRLSPFAYRDIHRNAVSTSITLEPFSSRILIRDTRRLVQK